MKKVNYTQFLTDEDKIKIAFTQDKGKISKFVVQYYSLINSRWRTIVRIDNCHSLSHKHTYHLHKKEFNVLLSGTDNNVVFTEAKLYIIQNFEKIKDNFLFSK